MADNEEAPKKTGKVVKVKVNGRGRAAEEAALKSVDIANALIKLNEIKAANKDRFANSKDVIRPSADVKPSEPESSRVSEGPKTRTEASWSTKPDVTAIGSERSDPAFNAPDMLLDYIRRNMRAQREADVSAARAKRDAEEIQEAHTTKMRNPATGETYTVKTEALPVTDPSKATLGKSEVTKPTMYVMYDPKNRADRTFNISIHRPGEAATDSERMSWTSFAPWFIKNEEEFKNYDIVPVIPERHKDVGYDKRDTSKTEVKWRDMLKEAFRMGDFNPIFGEINKDEPTDWAVMTDPTTGKAIRNKNGTPKMRPVFGYYNDAMYNLGSDYWRLSPEEYHNTYQKYLEEKANNPSVDISMYLKPGSQMDLSEDYSGLSDSTSSRDSERDRNSPSIIYADGTMPREERDAYIDKLYELAGKDDSKFIEAFKKAMKNYQVSWQNDPELGGDYILTDLNTGRGSGRQYHGQSALGTKVRYNKNRKSEAEKYEEERTIDQMQREQTRMGDDIYSGVGFTPEDELEKQERQLEHIPNEDKQAYHSGHKNAWDSPSKFRYEVRKLYNKGRLEAVSPALKKVLDEKGVEALNNISNSVIKNLITSYGKMSSKQMFDNTAQAIMGMDVDEDSTQSNIVDGITAGDIK